MIVCRCDGTLNGIFTAIYKAWELGTSQTRISVTEYENMELFSEYKYIEADENLAAKVALSIRNKLDDEIYYQVYNAALSSADDRGDTIYHFLIKAFRIGRGIKNHLADPDVMRILELERNVWRENHHYMGFLRFGQGDNFLVARMDPKNNVLDLVTHHFADRLLGDNFIIIDTTRHLCSLHRAGSRQYVITSVTDEYIEQIVDSTRESTSPYAPAKSSTKYTNESIEELWEIFRKHIAIEPRRNEKLQQQMMPLRYRTYMNTYTERS